MRFNIWYQHSNFPVEFYIFHRRAIPVNFFFDSWRHFFSIIDGIFCQLLKRITIHQHTLKYIANFIFTKINTLKVIANFGGLFQSIINHKNLVDQFWYICMTELQPHDKVLPASLCEIYDVEKSRKWCRKYKIFWSSQK